MKNLKIGEVLVNSGKVSGAQLKQALEYQKEQLEHKFLGEILVELGYISEDEITQSLAKQLRLPIMKRADMSPTPEAIVTMEKEKALEYVILPLKIEGETLYVVTDNPLNFNVFSEIKRNTGYEVEPCIAKRKYVVNAIEQAYTSKKIFTAVEEASEFKNLGVKAQLDEEKQSNERINNAPIVKTINMLIEEAIKQKASDIHIEPKEKEVVVRFRVDGSLVTRMKLKKILFSQMLSRLKILSGINIAEQRVPQDGGFTYKGKRVCVSLRVSTLPTYYGEKIVIRLLGDNRAQIVPVKELGMLNRNHQILDKLIHNPNGIILITGPTGSGKTTTIYSALNEVAAPSVNVVTIEDPVEKVIENVSQVPINAKAGMTFAAGLRSIMRQDPDIIMVGEIRDKETAMTAAQAAITGHLVFSTVHTNDAASTFMRLIDMGVEPYMVASSVIGVVAQRLVKLICPYCKEEYTPTQEDINCWSNKDIPVFYHGKGCSYCNQTGYSGRTSIHEIVVVTPNIRSLIMNKATAQEIKREAEKNGFFEMVKNMRLLIKNGKTTIEEMRKTIAFLE